MHPVQAERKSRRKVLECIFYSKKAVFGLSDSVIQRKEQAYKTTMFVLLVEKQLAQNMGTSNSGSGKTAKSKTCI